MPEIIPTRLYEYRELIGNDGTRRARFPTRITEAELSDVTPERQTMGNPETKETDHVRQDD